MIVNACAPAVRPAEIADAGIAPSLSPETPMMACGEEERWAHCFHGLPTGTTTPTAGRACKTQQRSLAEKKTRMTSPPPLKSPSPSLEKRSAPVTS